MTTATITKTNRVIFTCRNRNCKHVWVFEYKVFFANNELFRWIENAFGGKERCYYKDDINGRCPKCNSLYIDGNRVEGTVTGHVCNAKCMGATSGTCECSCGGANHGISHI